LPKPIKHKNRPFEPERIALAANPGFLGNLAALQFGVVRGSRQV